MSNKQKRAFAKPQLPPPNMLVVGLCVYDLMYAQFFEHFLKLQGWANKHIAISRNAYLPDGHNRLVKGALARTEPWDYMVFIEQDTLPPVEIFWHMELYQDPIIASLYFKKQMPPDPVAYHDDGLNITYLPPSEIVPMLQKPGLYPVDIVPMGCTAIRRDVLEHFQREGILWFDTGRREDNADLVSDDVWFCRNARKLGYQPLLNTATICTHVGNWEVTAETYRAWLRREIEINKPDGLLGAEVAANLAQRAGAAAQPVGVDRR